MSNSPDLQKHVQAMRTNCSKKETRAAFIDAMVLRCKELLQQKPREYDQMIQQLIDSLMQFNPKEDPPAITATVEILLEFSLSPLQVATCYNSIRVCLRDCELASSVMVTATFGKLLQVSQPNNIVRQQVDDSIRFLADSRTEGFLRRNAAALMLTEVAHHMPVMLIPKINEFFDNIWSSLSCAVQELRNRAVDCFKAGISVLRSRPRHIQIETFSTLFVRLRSHLQARNVDQLTAALLVFEPVLLSAADVFPERYEEQWSFIWPLVQKSDHTVTIKQYTLNCVVALAKYNTAKFCTNSLSTVVDLALSWVRRDSEKSIAFNLLCQIIAQVPAEAYARHLEKTIGEIKNCFIKHKRDGKPPVWEALACLATICRVSPSMELEAHVLSCIFHVFSWGLSKDLIHYLQTIIHSCSPKTKQKLQEHLLDMISLTLCGLPFRQSAQYSFEIKLDQIGEKDQSLVALNALNEFDFANSELMGDFLKDTVLPFLDHEEKSLRQAAISIVARLLFPSEAISAARGIVVESVIVKLLTVAGADTDRDVRLAILDSLTPSFYPFLAQNHYLSCLFAACGDECSEVREISLKLLCDLLPFNPSQILPALRKQMINLVGWSLKDDDRVSEDIRLITIFAERAPEFALTFMGNIKSTLRPHLTRSERKAPWILPLLQCLGAIAKAFGSGLVEEDFTSLAFTSICDLWNVWDYDRNAVRHRLAAMDALSSIVQHSGEVIKPFLSHPQLFRLLTSVVRNAEETLEIRLGALRTIGLIGAINPSHLQDEDEDEDAPPEAAPKAVALDQSSCCLTVLKALSTVINPNDSSLGGSAETLMRSAVASVMTVANRCAEAPEHLHGVIPSFVARLLSMQPGRLRTTIYAKLAEVVRLSGSTAAEYVEALFNLILQFWDSPDQLMTIVLCKAMNSAIRSEFALYYPQLMPRILRSMSTASSDFTVIWAVLDFLQGSTSELQSFTDSIVQELLSLLKKPLPGTIAAAIIGTLSQMGMHLSLQEVAGAIVRTVLTVLEGSLTDSAAPQTVRLNPIAVQSMLLFTVLAVQLQASYAKFIPMVHRVIEAHHLSTSRYQFTIRRVCSGAQVRFHEVVPANEMEILPSEVRSEVQRAIKLKTEVWGLDEAVVKLNDGDLPIDETVLLTRCESANREQASKAEWMEWFNKFALDVLQQSPLIVFRCVAFQYVAENTPSFVGELFNAAFCSLWDHSSIALQTKITACFTHILSNTLEVPDEVILMILDLIEFMDCLMIQAPIQKTNLAAVAELKGVLAKALRWKEQEFRENPDSTVLGLLHLYSKLGHTESALGMLNTASPAERSKLMQSSLARLGRHSEALEVIERGFELVGTAPKKPRKRTSIVLSPRPGVPEDPGNEGDSELRLARVQCLSAVGDVHRVLAEWRNLYFNATAKSHDLSPSSTGSASPKRDEDEEEEESLLACVAPYAADAALQLKAWDSVESALRVIPRDTHDFFVTHAVLSINRHQWVEAQTSIDQARKLLLNETASLLSESYVRAYDSIVLAQQLAELEEILEVLQLPEAAQSQRKEQLIDMWSHNITSISPSVSHWKRLLSTRGLLLSPREDVRTRVAFVQLCRQNSQFTLERFALDELLGCSAASQQHLLDPRANLTVVFEYIKHLSARNELGAGTKFGDEATLLEELLRRVENDSRFGPLAARVCAQLGPLKSGNEAVKLYERATKFDPEWFHGWHLWASELASRMSTWNSSENCIKAISSYIKSINLGQSTASVFQDILKLLSLWSQNAEMSNVIQALELNLPDIPLFAWLLVVPQLIARMDFGCDESCALVRKVLIDIGKTHPHTLIYPLIVCSAATGRRLRSAQEILDHMRHDHPELVAEGIMVSSELVRITSRIPHEVWHNALEKAGTDFFSKKNYNNVVECLLPLHESLRKPPETLLEADFSQRFGHVLAEAQEWLRSYTRTKRVEDLHSAWALYSIVHYAILPFLQMSTLDLQYCSLTLFEAQNLRVTLPGARATEKHKSVCIAGFDPKIKVIPSKQRPRKIAILGTDGSTHKFLLKGGEDLRLDERVMQLFKLYNTILVSHPNTRHLRGYQIQRYSVTPLWTDVGLIGWVDKCDTLEDVIGKYRSARKISHDLEIGLMTDVLLPDVIPPSPDRVAPVHEALTLLQKVEVFEYLMDHTSGQDLRKAMWIAAANSELWLMHRTAYIRSLATMSMAGYILGLGDRHSQNLMIQRHTGKVVHIDFGDCFEVTMKRDKWPERVPFRLTRMLRNAMEVSGVEGHFRSAAEIVMTAIRDHRSSVLAMLEAFLYDPLISMRLVTQPLKERGGVAEALQGLLTEETSKDTVLAHSPKGSNSSTRFDQTITFADLQLMACSTDLWGAEPAEPRERISPEAISILRRLESKLRGKEKEFIGSSTTGKRPPLTVKEQVSRLLVEATSVSNLSQSYLGWKPFW